MHEASSKLGGIGKILRRVTAFDDLVEEYPAWWIDFLGEHNHVGAADATNWLLTRSGLEAGRTMLDAGAFVGSAARLAVEKTGCSAYATDLNPEFLATGRSMQGGDAVEWLLASTHKLPFPDMSFDSVWSLDSYLAPREMSRVAKQNGATLCICCELPVDARGGMEAFVEEWAEYGWEMGGHRSMTLEALQVWRHAEAAFVAKRSYYEPRYGKRAYLGQLDLLGNMVQQYERGEVGHALLVFRR